MRDPLRPSRPPLPHSPARGQPFEQLAEVALALHELARAITSLRRLAPEGGQLRVLLVQADPGFRADLCRELLAGDHHVTEAASFADALVHLASDAVNVVITDDRLDAACSGRMLLAEVRTRWPFVRRVLCTAQRAELTDPLDPTVVQRLLELPVEGQLLRASLL